MPRRRKTLISNRGRWSSLSLFRQIHLREGKLWFQTGGLWTPAQPFQASPDRKRETLIPNFHGTGQQLYHYPSLGGVYTWFVLTTFEGTTQGQYWSIQEGACGTAPALVWRTTRCISLGDRLLSKRSYALIWCMPNNDDKRSLSQNSKNGLV